MTRPRPVRSAATCVGASAAALALLSAPGAFAKMSDIAGDGVGSIKIVRQLEAESTSSQTLVASGARTTIKVSDATLVTVRLSAQSACSRTDGQGTCMVAIFLTPADGGDEIEMRPGAQTFDATSTASGQGFPEAHTTDRSAVVGKGGKYQAEVRYAVSDPNMTFELASWSMTVETAPAEK